MKKLAGDIGLPVTAFALPRDDEFLVRFFTAQGEELTRADQASVAVGHVILNAGLCPRSGVFLISRDSRRELMFDSATGEPGLRLDALDRRKLEPADAARLRAGLGLAADDLIVAESSGSFLMLHCRSAKALDKVRPPETLAAESQRRGLLLTAPLDRFGPGYESLLVQGPAGNPSLPEAGLDLDFHGAAAFFWSRTLASLRLAIRQRGCRGLMTATLLPGEDRISIGGRVTTILAADPVDAGYFDESSS